MHDDDEVIELFDRATNLPAARRQAFLDAHCAGRPALRAELESLLGHAEPSRDFLEEPHADLTPLADPTPPTRVGPYRLIERIGEGGFGEVWRGEQSEPIARTVAVKLIRAGVVSAAARARFDSERQALALLEHPGIARIHDAGTTDDGQPWYAMELVDGPTLTAFARRHRLGLQDRVQLMIQVCHALHHAHERGIIHRDLKPSNVLVAEIDGRPQPKLIDFGIAKLREADAAWRTQDGQVVGTPAYMSPEQARGDVDAVDARTDVHALGLLLFELLTGSLPFLANAANAAGVLALQRMICEVDAPRPSSRITDRAAAPDYRPPVLARAVRGDLDWIVLRALAKPREGRYPSALALAADLERFLADQPVHATPQQTLYRTRKWLLRHRAVSFVGAVALVLGAVGLFGTLQNRSRAERSEAATRAEAAKLGAVNQFLRNLLANADPERVPGQEVTVRDVLEEAERQLATEVDPDVEIALRHTIGMSFRGLGRRDDAERNLRRALELADRGATPERGAVRRELGLLFADAGRATEARGLLDAALDFANTGGDPLEIALARDARGLLATQRADYTAAQAEFEAALATADALPNTGPIATAIRIHLSDALEGAGDYANAERTLDEARARATAAGTSALPQLLQIEDGRSHLLLRRARPMEALTIAHDCVQLAEQIYGPTHFEVGYYRCNNAEILQSNDRLLEAEMEFRAGIDLLRKNRPEGSISEARALGNLGWTLSRIGRNDDAEPVMRDALAMRRRLLGADHPDVANSLRDLAKVLRARNANAEAEQACREALDICRRRQGEDHLNTAFALHALSLTLLAQDRDADGAACLEEAVRIAAPVLPATHQHLSEFRLRLGTTYLKLGRLDDARPLLEAAYQALVVSHGADNARTGIAVRAMCDLATRKGDDVLLATWRARLPPEARGDAGERK